MSQKAATITTIGISIVLGVLFAMFLFQNALKPKNIQKSVSNVTPQDALTNKPFESSATINPNRKPLVKVVYEGSTCTESLCKEGIIYDDGSYNDKKLNDKNLEELQKYIKGLSEKSFGTLAIEEQSCNSANGGIDKGFIFITSKVPDKKFIMCKTLIPKTDTLFTILNTITYNSNLDDPKAQ